MKAYTDLEQSKILSQILPLESSDMFFSGYTYPKELHLPTFSKTSIKDIPCWSLAALLGVLPKIINNETLFIETSAVLWHIGYRNIYIARASNLVDACYELILKLNELKML